ncbi:MAG: head-tail adaptor protein [Clostridiales bacterium]|nr:head-tail adaptor protein [Clostridiales bacterium]
MSYKVNLASDLRHRAAIRRMVTATERDELGQYPVLENTVCTVWCAVVPQTGSLLSGRVADTQISRTTHKVVIRYRPGITEDMWMEIGGVRYDVLYILDPYLRHETLELFCEVRTDGSQ